MRLWEFANTESQKLYALSEFLLGRAEDSDSEKTIGIKDFLSLAKGMGLNINPSMLRDLATQPPLNSIIVNVTGDEVVFAGAGKDTKVSDQMTVTQAQDVVAKMANRALPDNLK
jgi:hypothetical protein